MRSEQSKRLTLVLGGVRSGKSSYATSLAKESKLPVTYIASGLSSDPEMRRRFEEHKKSRPKSWSVIEANGKVVEALEEVDLKSGLIILDCLTMFVGELVGRYQISDDDLIDEKIEKEISKRVDEFLDIIGKLKSTVIVVSNEVGLGVVPPYPAGRLFRDLVGLTNRKLAEQADEVIMMTAGIPVEIKNVKCKMKNENGDG